ncbi:AI-2E family transporter [Agromyces mangrovi Wang et al. 2018]|uniref:AI-2E family transporter n=1 Tax=Agromyces mangrovi TaxID=1858653 RepID=UPI00257280EC|nr:AI-2E family transporter [Agromyces mangrovi]BDZ64852.1 AI-2E family transporter [Agromyces mangrovi]
MKRSSRRATDASDVTEPAERAPRPIVSLMSNHPFRWAFVATLGVLLALFLAQAALGLSSVIFAVFAALFISLGLDPLIRWFQRRGMKRGWAIVTVILLFVGVVVGMLLLVIPLIVTQAVEFIQGLPQAVADIQQQDWYLAVEDFTGGAISGLYDWLLDLVTDPNTWATVGGGALAVAGTVVNAISSGFFIFILTIYFVATLDTMKKASYSLISASHRETVVGYAERIMDSIGRYLSGMVILAFFNATYSLILLIIVGVPYAIVIASVAFLITLIPLIGTVLTTIAMTIVALFVSPTAAIIVLIFMLIYMQVEAYILTPRVMSKAVSVPGSLVLIAALAGGTLAGLPGALVAIPIAAGILLIIREVVVPKKAVS